MRVDAGSRQRGGALVEFAMILPVAMVFIFAIIQFGLAMFEYHATAYAAKYAARYASVRGAECAANKTAGCPLTAAALETAVRKAVPGLEPKATISPGWSAPSTATYPGSGNSGLTCDLADQNAGCIVTVKVTNPAALNIPFLHLKKDNKFTFTAYGQQFVTQ